jgi:hypothetical protein
LSSPLSKRKREGDRITRSAEKNPPDRAGRNGGKLKTGNKGHDGTRAGRKPQAYKDFIEKVLTGKRHLNAVQWVLEHRSHPAFASVYGKVLIHHLGIPAAKDPGDGATPHISIDV